MQKIEQIYQEECNYMNLYQHQSVLVGHKDFVHYKLNGKYVSILETILMQLSTDSIFDSMQFLSVEDRLGFIKWVAMMKIKIHRDGFVFNLGSRTNMLIIFTNCSIPNGGSSRNCSCIIALINSDEDRFTLSLISQKVDMELLYLNILGVVCPRTGRNVGIVCFNVEDTGSLEKTFGKDCASGAYRWHLSVQNKIKHHYQWFTYHLPISVDIKLADDVWQHFDDTFLVPYLQTNNTTLTMEHKHLCEFNKSYSNPIVQEHAEAFKKIRKKINASKASNHGFIGNWHGAKSIWTFGADGLHLVLRILNHTTKKIILFSLDYCKFLRSNREYVAKNHPDVSNYQILEQNQILSHFKNCCKVPFHYDPNNPGRLRISSGLLYIYVYILQLSYL